MIAAGSSEVAVPREEEHLPRKRLTAHRLLARVTRGPLLTTGESLVTTTMTAAGEGDGSEGGIREEDGDLG